MGALVFCRVLLTLLLLLAPARVLAAYEIGFYAHEFGSSFPHAFFTVKGRPDGGGAEVDTNYGFTAKSVTPAILLGPVAGIIEQAKPSYVRSSKRHFSVTVDDGGYARLMAVVADWRGRGPRSYDLNRANCVHFIGEAARAAGLRVDFPKKLMKKPRSYLLHILSLNPQVKPAQ